MNVFYEEDGEFKVGAVLADNDTSLQVEAPHGKRSKVKASTVLPIVKENIAKEARIMTDDAATYYDKLDILAHISPDGKKMNWGRATGDGFMGGIRTFVMDVSSLDLGKENYVPFDPSWGKKMETP